MPRHPYRFIYTSLLPPVSNFYLIMSRSATDNLFEFELVTLVITDYMLRYHNGELA